jgi:hypothetical protein
VGEENQKMMIAFAEQLMALGKRFSEFGKYVMDGLRNAYTALTRYISSLIRSIRDWASNIGRSFIYGIGDGINAAWSWLIDVIRNLAASILETARAALQASSPSMLAAKMIGIPIAEGIGLGLKMGMRDVYSDFAHSLISLPAASNVERARLGTAGAAASGGRISVGHIEYHGAFSHDELQRLERRQQVAARNALLDILG